jgi:hypothetical protein
LNSLSDEDCYGDEAEGEDDENSGLNDMGNMPID